MILLALKPILQTKSLRSILESKDLAHLGDFLANLIYTTVRIGMFNKQGSIHVWDYSLRSAMEMANLRVILGKKTKPDKVADAAEALIAYTYFSKLMELDEMVEYLTIHLKEENFKSNSIEKLACAYAFSELFKKIVELAEKEKRFG